MDLYPRVAAEGIRVGESVTGGGKIRTEQIFLEAAELPQERRAAFLDEACGTDAALRGEVESLLRHHDTATIGGILRRAPETQTRTGGTVGQAAKVARFAATVLGKSRSQVQAYLLSALLLGGLGYWVRNQVRDSLRGQVREQLQVVLNADVAALNIWITGWIREADVWAKDRRLVSLSEKLVGLAPEDPERGVKLRESPLQREFAAVLKPYLAETASSDDVVAVLLDRTGFRIAATPPYLDAIGRKSSTRAAGFMVPLLEGRSKFGPPSRFDSWSLSRPVNPSPFVLVAVPVRSSTGEIIAVLTLAKKLESSRFSEILGIARMGQSGETYAISPEGLLLSPSRFEEANKRAGLVPQDPMASSVLNVQVRDPGGNLLSGFTPEVALEARPLTKVARMAVAIRDKPEAPHSGVVTEPYRDYRGIDVLGAWHWLPEHDFGIITEVDAKEAFAASIFVERVFEALFALLVVFVGITLLVSVSLARLRPRNDSLPRMGSYMLLRSIGEGGMGRVYLARHAMLRRLTAVKVLNTSNPVDENSGLQFEREAQAASGLTHPNTIEIYDFGRTPEGTFYYAMEYLEGVTLASLISLDGTVPASRVIHILRQVCASLQEAHHKGLLHGDIKPSNIMLCERGGVYDFVKVLDFGLVRPLDALPAQDGTGDRVFGTLLYMPPERFRVPCEADVRSDVYSLGAVAYHLLAGRPVFQAANGLDLLGQILHTEAERAPGRQSDPVPERLWELVMECLATDPSGRPQSIATFLEHLDAIKETEPWTQQDAQDWWLRRAPSMVKASARIKLS